MTPLDALLELLARVGASQGVPVLVSEEELSRWPATAVRILKSQKLLVRASPATSVVCSGCEQQCAMLVHTIPAGTRPAAPFVVCDKRDDINRVPVPIERLRQWQCSVEAVRGFVAKSLGVRPTSRPMDGTGLWEIGIAAGKKRKRMLCIQVAGELQLVGGNNAVPLADLVSYDAGNYAVDSATVQQLVDTATTGDSSYTPSNTRQEIRKLATRELYESWRKEYRALKQRRSDMSDVWYSRQIAKLEIAERRSAETIRKNMKS